MFIVFLGNCIELESIPQGQAVRTKPYGPLNQPITAHLLLIDVIICNIFKAGRHFGSVGKVAMATM